MTRRSTRRSPRWASKKRSGCWRAGTSGPWPIPEIGLRRILVSDGPIGVRGEPWDEPDPSIALPSPTALAATWDPALARRPARCSPQEARRKDVDVLLAPTVNLHRSPLGGRHFEAYSEDP